MVHSFNIYYFISWTKEDLIYQPIYILVSQKQKQFIFNVINLFSIYILQIGKILKMINQFL